MQLLHLDSSIMGEGSASRALSRDLGAARKRVLPPSPGPLSRLAASR